MKNLVLLAFTGFLVLSCSRNDDANNRNPYLHEHVFDTGATINTNFPQYNDLQLPGGSAVIYEFGINGIAIFHANGSYRAFELSDPNHALQTCSRLSVDGFTASCGCSDDKQYNIVTGQAETGTTGQYTLKPYFVEASGNIIRVFNN